MMKNDKFNRLFDLLPEIEGTKKFGKTMPAKRFADGSIQMPFTAEAEIVHKVRHAIFQLEIEPFDWPGWRHGKDLLKSKNPDFSKCDTETLCKLLLMLYRADRFNDGLLRVNMENGNVTKIIQALKNKMG